ncbi:glucose dehydrogenase [FAD, quinone]-like [Schistocerca americana]|uniref:glucose dehydrogenase [FAD, quinone]-like n=1 Tax=Schistocerca americana TaxID=7009 RepID=UPI001F4F968B|nr:glucose dehydrogenase [FAD, quinone]-like [Schistocerca americana]
MKSPQQPPNGASDRKPERCNGQWQRCRPALMSGSAVAASAQFCGAGSGGGSAGSLFCQLLASLAHAQCALADRGAFPRDASPPLPQYDFVVVGAGSAGAAVASRLSENPAWNVLLLEAGGDPTPTSDVPSLFPTLQLSNMDWTYRTEPENQTCLAQVNGRCAWPRGKGLGGTSSINGMLYIRGSQQDYDGWAALGNDGWSYREVLPFFKKLEAFDEEQLKKRPLMAGVHGRSGPIYVTKLERLDPAFETLDAAAKELGYKIIEDYSAEPLVGFGDIHCSIKNGTRWSTARGYLTPVTQRSNLHVLKFAYVTKVLIREKDQAAYGVQFLKDGTVKEVRARKEVILSAGVINTPHILMHSGIGPKAHLDKVGVRVLKDLRVGYNLQDHLAYIGLYYRRQKLVGTRPEEDLFKYLMNKTGPLSTIRLFSYTGFTVTDKAPPTLPGIDPTDYPDIQLLFVLAQSNTASVVAKAFNLNDEVTSTLKKLVENEDVILVSVTLLAPRSRGRVKLRTADPMDLPLIYPGYLGDPGDFENLLAGVEIAHRLGSTEAMKKAGYSVKEFPLKNCNRSSLLKHDYWRCAVPYLTSTLFHPVGTAKMGPSADADAVVDPWLRVRGVRNLRVADASVMPVIVRCNTNVASIMIGEKCAHVVTEEWRDLS